jgi:predicted amidohydrolase YtcJ
MYADESITRIAIPLIGATRARRMYPFNSVARTGARIATGSDWPVSTPNPFLAMEVGITRQSPKPPYGAPWIPSEQVSLTRLLAAYTTGGVYANHRERETGSLEPGKAADFIVIDRNLLAIRPHGIGKTRVLCTLVDGRSVYEYRPGKTCRPD